MDNEEYELTGLEEHERDEEGAQWGDPRRCPRHPNIVTSSPDGMFDGLCGACENEMDDHREREADTWLAVRENNLTDTGAYVLCRDSSLDNDDIQF